MKQREAERAIHTLLSDLKSSAMKRDLHWGRRLHASVVESRNDTNTYVVTALIRMYAKCNSMLYARHIFNNVNKPDVVLWNVLLLGYADNGEGYLVLDLLAKMKARGYPTDSVSYLAAVKACTSLAVISSGIEKRHSLEQGRKIHSEIGHHLDHQLQSALIVMYAKCGSMVDARNIFDSIKNPDAVVWNAILLGYAENGEGGISLDLFSKMKTRGYAPDPVTYVAALKACASQAVNTNVSGKGVCLERGREIHLMIGCDLDHYVQAALIDMYAKCGSMVDARCVFDSIENPDVVCWNALLLGYAENREAHNSLELFLRMKARKCPPNSVTYVAAVKACSCLPANEGDGLERGREIHSEIGRHLDQYLRNVLIDMYANFGSMVEACRVFDSIQKPDVVSWTALLWGYAGNGEGLVALDLLSKMKARGCIPNYVTYVAALKACCVIGALALGRKFHSEISEVTAHVVTCLVDFYAKCGSMVEAREVFDLHSRTRDIRTWNALLAGYSSFGDIDTSFKLLEAMQDEGLHPDAVTCVCILLCCSHGGFVEKAKEYFEAMPLQHGVVPTLVHYTCMVDVLGRANKLHEAIGMLQKMPCNPDAVIWKALLAACRKWKNVEMGKMAYQSLLGLDKKDTSAHILMSDVYKVQERAKSGQAYVTDGLGKMVKFEVGEQDPPEVEDKLQQLCEGDINTFDNMSRNVKFI